MSKSIIFFKVEEINDLLGKHSRRLITLYLFFSFTGYCIQSAVKRLDLGGLTSYLQILLPEKGHDFVTTGNI